MYDCPTIEILPRYSEVAGGPEKTFATTGRKGKFAPIYRGSFCGTKTQTCCLPVNPVIKKIKGIGFQVIFC